MRTLFNAHTHTSHESEHAIYQLNELVNIPDSGLFSVGIHPQNSSFNFNTNREEFIRIVQHKRCVAIGEIGLDNRFDVPIKQQELLFIAQLKIAQIFNKPIILHCVSTWDRCRYLHQQFAPSAPLIYHGFSKASLVLNVLAYKPAIISLGHAALTNEALQKVVKHIPSNRLLLETDTSETELSLIYQQVAQLKSLSLSELEDTINNTVKQLFRHE